jgi:enoyl-CoA hydratase/carnithine racemase
MEERVRIDAKDGIADVKLVRAEKLNALDAPMFVALVEAGQTIIRDPSVRAVVLSGEGRAFCAGLDLSNHARGRRTAALRTPESGQSRSARRVDLAGGTCP